MIRGRWPVLAMLMTAVLASEEPSKELSHSSFLQTFGLGLRDLVTRTFTLCGSELLGLKRDMSLTGQVRNSLCTFLLRPHTDAGRGHYGAPSYNTHGFDPLTLLAGLAFLAFLLQTLHALLYRQTATIPSSIGLSRKVSDSSSELEHTVKTALDKYEILNSQRSISDDTQWQWPSFSTFMRNFMSSYGGPCFHNPLCHLIYQDRQPKS